MTLMKIRLALGRTRQAPEGDSRHGYEFVAPLDEQNHIDAAAWAKLKDRCTVRSFRPGQDQKTGYLRHVGNGWRFDYEPGRHDDDEPFFKLDKHVIAQGLYLTVTEPDGGQQPFRIVDVSPVSP
jgi:hypothetical protein